ncbi:kinesin-like protein [Achlya hypogyna]|uniref:Kinesin-like protein n=1 Tax=Achlya hypogyna TaxID=1202772 RepID=A0A1V9ZU63_ACHHY|nr:kinesin-like protein [Achlya hypogyna]
MTTAPCCGQSWSDPKVPHFCSLIRDAEAPSMHPGPRKGSDDAKLQGSATPTASATDAKSSSSSVVKGGAKGTAEAIQVLIRIRPLIERETAAAAQAAHFIRATSEDTIEVQTADSNIKCKYDAVFGPSVSQEDVYERVRECTESFLSGFNATLFAYGQTGSGKSFTMFGAETDESRYRPGLAKSQAGIIPRAIKDIFAGMVKMTSGDGVDCALFCSFVQIYNENVYDLLRDGKMDRPLAVHEDRVNGIYVEGLSEYAVRSVHDCLALLQSGEDNRAVRATHMNLVSSRSHSAFQIFLEAKRKDGTVTRSKFNLVDLAGSEKWHPDASMQYSHISEMTNINLSLHTLGRCIGALSTKGSHVPYRDSKLTRLLQDSLGGNTKTRIIATLSPSVDCIEESIATLKFADRAKQVMVCVRVNEQRVIDPAYVEKLEAEIAELRGLLASFDGGSSPNQVDSQLMRLLKENADVKAQNAKLRRDLDDAARGKLLAPEVATGNNADLGDDRTRHLVAQNQLMEGLLGRLKDATERFFKFEIEEDELKGILEASFRSLKPSGTPIARPAVGAATFSRLRTKSAVTMPKAADVAFRVRGKTSSDADATWQTDAPKRSEEDEIKAAEKAMKKQAKIQAWLLEKERREMAKLQQQQEYIDEQRKLQAEKDAKFFKRAQETKKKLSATPVAE